MLLVFFRLHGLTEMLGDELHEHLAHERRFTRSGYTRDSREHADRNIDGHFVEIVALDVAQSEPAFGCAHLMRRGVVLLEKITARHGLFDLRQTFTRAAI